MTVPHAPERSRTRRPSAALVVSVAALVVASGGVSYASGMIGSADIKDDSVKSRDLKDDTVRSRDVKDGTLKARDFRAGVLPEGSTRWLLVNAAGEIEAQSGGFTVTSAYPTLAPTATDPTGLRANGNIYIDAHEPLDNNAVLASIALQNQVDQNGDGVLNGRAAGADANPEFSGEVSATQCQLDGVVACAPPGTGTDTHFAVSPRHSDGSVTTDGNRKRFYVVIAGDSTDLVPAP